jgi:flavin-dependent dehydrogenase
MKKSYDVIIIGAGPAGLRCAEQFINSEMSVLLVEKNRTIGPKTCGGGLTGLYEKTEIPKNKIRIFPNIYAVLNSNKYKIKLFSTIKTVDRYDLGQHQLKKIKNKKNISILTDTTVNIITRKKIVTNKGSFSYKYLIGADGAYSLTRKFLGLKNGICVGILYKISKITNKLIWNFDPINLKSGYLWVFPHKTHTNIGVYFDPKFVNAKTAKLLLEEYLRKNNYKFNNKDIEGGPVNYNYQGCEFDNIFLIGDAAGLTSKIWGEGIPYAMISGEEIAKKIQDPTYSMPKLKKIIRIKNRQDRIAHLIDYFPSFQNYFMKLWILLISYYWFQNYFGIIESKSIIKRKKELDVEFDDFGKWIRIR